MKFVQFGKKAWDKFVDGVCVPDIDNESKYGCKTMRGFMQRFDEMANSATAKTISATV